MNKKSVCLGFGLFCLGLILTSPLLAWAETKEEKEARLTAELRRVEQEIAGQKTLLQAKQKETTSIKRDVDILTYKINTAQLNIKAKQLLIERLGGDIQLKVKKIVSLNDQLGQEQLSLSELLRQTRELDDNTFAEIVLARDSLSNFFIDAQRFRFVGESVQTILAEIRSTKTNTEAQKIQLEDRRSTETNAKKEIEKEKVNIERLNQEKKALLSISKAQEGAYRKVIAQKEQERATIRSALFRLRDTSNITFGQALDYAKSISAKIGVRPAFLLAIITQESNLGQNIGTCNRPGDPPSKSYRAVMKPERDIPPFLRITKALGLDPEIQPVSCPYMGGYGGAMGPAQFIPSTWESFTGQIAKVTGNNPPNPWVPIDAFTASGLYLADLGADAGTYTAERRAALKYYAGGNWASAKNAFYGDQVMKIATGYEQQIAILQND